MNKDLADAAKNSKFSFGTPSSASFGTTAATPAPAIFGATATSSTGFGGNASGGFSFGTKPATSASFSFGVNNGAAPAAPAGGSFAHLGEIITRKILG
jgi:hypothetical protein